jgi:hypothetical protein
VTPPAREDLKEITIDDPGDPDNYEVTVPACFECDDRPALLVGPEFGRADLTCRKCILELMGEGLCPVCFNEVDMDPPECGLPPACPQRDDGLPLPSELDGAIIADDGLPLVPPP